MPKAIVIEDEWLEHAIRFAKVSSSESGVRDVARNYQSHYEVNR